MDLQPYVAYRVTADIADKGIGFTIKKAITNFFGHHNIFGKVTEFQASSGQFECVVLLYNGNDLNKSALESFITNSGRLPSEQRARPALEITALRPEEYLDDFREKLRTFEQQNATVTQLNSDHEKDKSTLHKKIDELTKLLDNRQKALGDKEREITQLKYTLERVTPVNFATPLEATLKGYLKNAIDVLLEAHIDYASLESSQDLPFYLSIAGRAEQPTFAEYIKHKTGRSFSSDEALELWSQNLAHAASWEQSCVAQALLEKRDQIEKDYSFLKTAEQTGISKNIIDAMRAALGDQTVGAIDIAINESQAEFIKEKDAHAKIESLTEPYQKLISIYQESSKRRKKESTLPIIAHVAVGKTPAVTIYLPIFSEEDSLHSRLKEEISRFITAPYALLVTSSLYSTDIAKHCIAPANLPDQSPPGDHLAASIERFAAELPTEPLFNAFGIKPKVTRIVEHT